MILVLRSVEYVACRLDHLQPHVLLINWKTGYLQACKPRLIISCYKLQGNGRTFYPITFQAPSDFTLAKVGQPLYIVGQRKRYVWNPSKSSRIPTLSELTINKTLRRNRKSRAGIFSMEDVLVDHETMWVFGSSTMLQFL